MASLDDLRQTLFDRVDWDPGASEEAVRRVNGFINDALEQAVLDAPFLFYEDSVRFRTQPSVEPTLVLDGLTVITDTTPANTPENPWVLTTTLDRSTSGVVAWKNDRTWDGRWLDIMDTSGNVLHRTRIQSVSFYNNGANDLVKVAITTPIDHETHGTGPFKYRVYTPVYWVRDDVIEVRNARLLTDDTRQSLSFITQEDAEYNSLVGDDSVDTEGTPSLIYRRGNFTLPGPNTAPLAEIGDPAELTERWQGPEPPGKFSYRITFTWGKRSSEYQSAGPGWWAGPLDNWTATGPGSSGTDKAWAEDRSKEPLWESAPSPISAEVTVSAPATTSTTVGAVKLTLPNIEYMLGYLLAGTTSAATAFERASTGLSGWHVRVYRRRHTEDFTNYTGFGNNQLGQSIDSLVKLDIDDSYYLLAEMAIDDINGGVIWDYGRILPDYRRKLRSVHGYQGIQMWPWPDAEYDVELRVLKRPERLTSGSDVPHIRSELQDLILTYAMSYLYGMIGDPAESMKSMRDYESQLAKARKRYGDARPASQPMRMTRTRASGFRRRRAMWNRINEDG